MPIITADLIITYTLIWVFRTFFFSYNLAKSYHYSQKAQKTNWNKLLEYLETPSKLKYSIEKQQFSFDPLILRLKTGPLEPALLTLIEELKQKEQFLKPSEVIHCLNLITYKESYEVLKTSIESYVQSNYNLKKVIFLLACE